MTKEEQEYRNANFAVIMDSLPEPYRTLIPEAIDKFIEDCTDQGRTTAMTLADDEIDGEALAELVSSDQADFLIKVGIMGVMVVTMSPTLSGPPMVSWDFFTELLRRYG